MRASVSSHVVLVGLIAGVASIYGCSDKAEDPSPFTTGTAGATPGTAGTPPTGQSGSLGMAGTPPTTAGAGGAATGTAGTPPTGTAGTPPATAGASGGGNTAGASGAGGGGGGGNTMITKVWASTGCGAGAGAAGNFTIKTMGTKAADCAAHLKDGTKKCGPWTLDRKYKVILPDGYDKTKPATLMFEGPGCGGNENSLYTNINVGNTIRVGLAPPDPAIGHGTNPGEGCFDDKEGDDSVDWVFYETLYDKLNTDYCFDRNRVFSGGNSSGAWFSNELACKYAGDAMRPVRGATPNTGGLPTEANYVPTCTNNGMAGMWIHEKDDGVNPFTGNKVAIARAMKVNKCPGTGYDDAQKEDFPIGGGKPANTCQRIKGCDPLFPLVVCLLQGNSHASHDDTVRPAWPAFLKLFDTAPLAP